MPQILVLFKISLLKESYDRNGIPLSRFQLDPLLSALHSFSDPSSIDVRPPTRILSFLFPPFWTISRQIQDKGKGSNALLLFSLLSPAVRIEV